jgi:putative DNA primase/helicase
MSWRSIEDACRTACIAIGVDYKAVLADGEFHRADLSDDSKGKNDASIKIFPDQQGGIVWNHKSGQRETFFVNDSRGGSGEPISQIERERIQREQQRRQAEQQKRQDKAARKAQSIWQAAKPAPPDHPYLLRKQIKPHGLRIGSWARSIQDDQGKFHKLIIDDVLLVPMFDAAGSLRSLQAIFKETHPELDRDKDFFPGAGIAGLFWWIGAKSDPGFIAEGAATATSLHEETGCRVFIAFSAGNLLAVGKTIRERLPDTELIFCADNDQNTLGNPGVTSATAAAAAIGAEIYIPPFSGDYNDYVIYKRSLENERG